MDLNKSVETLDPGSHCVASMTSNFSALATLNTRTRWRTRPCVLARAQIGHANAAWKSGLRTLVSDRNLNLMNRWAVALSASNVRSAQCTFSHSLIRHSAARTTTVKCSGASNVASSRASNAGKAAPATTAPTMSSSACDTPIHLAPSPIPLGAPREVVRGREGGWRDWAPTSGADGPLCPRGAKLAEFEGDVVLSRPREATSCPGSFSGNLCGDRKIAVASRWLQSFSRCWDIDMNLNLCKHLSVNLCARLGGTWRSLVGTSM